MFATYGDEAFYSSRPNEVESNIISIFLRDGTFELGIRELTDKDRDSWKFEQVTAGYTFKDKFSFVACDRPLLWILNVSERSWRKFPAPVSLWSADVLTGDDKAAYAIVDHRRLLSIYPDRPPFETRRLRSRGGNRLDARFRACRERTHRGRVCNERDQTPTEFDRQNHRQRQRQGGLSRIFRRGISARPRL